MRRRVFFFFAVSSCVAAACARPSAQAPVAAPTHATASAASEPKDPCAELYQPLAAIPGAIVPAEYPFVVKPDPSAAERQQSACARAGPPCVAAGMDARGLLQRVEIEVPVSAKRSSVATEARGIEIVRALQKDFGLTVVPRDWTRTHEGAVGFDIDPADGFGRVRFALETRPEMADDWHGTITLEGITGLRLGGARPLPKQRIVERLIGRRYCVDVPTGEVETRTMARACDPPAGVAYGRCEEKVQVPLTRRELRTVAADGPTKLRAALQLTLSVNEGPHTARLTWALWRGEEPSNYESTLLVDAFTGATLSPYHLAGARRIARADP